MNDNDEYEPADGLLPQHSEELQVIFDSIPAWIVYRDKENHFLRVNKAFCDAMKMSREQLEGKSLFDLYPKEQAEARWQHDKDVMASGKAKRSVIESIACSNGMRWVQTDTIPYQDLNGNILGVIGFSVDITARKNTEETLEAVNDEERLFSQEREQLVEQLQNALARIKTLDSLLPICAKCKRIRDEQGRWNHLESYVSSRTDAQFTHGFCQECADNILKELK